MTGVLQVSTATATHEAARHVLQGAVRTGLAAGGQISGPLETAFWHEGQFGVGEEWRILLFTVADRYEDLEAYILATHEWQKPEIMAVAVTSGFEPYLAWIRQATARR